MWEFITFWVFVFLLLGARSRVSTLESRAHEAEREADSLRLKVNRLESKVRKLEEVEK